MTPKIIVCEDDFDVAAELKALSADNHEIGAVVSFTGLVRDMASEPITSMTLEHYPPMTISELERITADATERWPLNAITVIHRYGELFPGDQIVLVATASAHREAALESAAYIMDFLKSNAPFWKKEKTSDSENWVEAKDKDDDALKKW